MREYLVYHGNFMTPVTEPGKVSFRSNGNTILVRGEQDEAKRWAEILQTSSLLRNTMKNGEVSLETFAFANKYVSWTWFTDKEFDEFKDVYNDVKGTTIVVKIKPENNEEK